MIPELLINDLSGIQDCTLHFEDDAGFDVRANGDYIIAPMEIQMVSTGLHLGVPARYEIQVRPRSGLAGKYGITVLNSPGTIDKQYTGECNVILINLGTESFEIRKGDRIAQFVLCPIPKYTIKFVDTLETTERGSGGFGHTGVK